MPEANPETMQQAIYNTKEMKDMTVFSLEHLVCLQRIGSIVS